MDIQLVNQALFNELLVSSESINPSVNNTPTDWLAILGLLLFMYIAFAIVSHNLFK